jgi:hypothetical protein
MGGHPIGDLAKPSEHGSDPSARLAVIRGSIVRHQDILLRQP